jgi:glycosyltransferase involved in cell wall biosynthesis
MEISIVIPCLNGAATITDQLDALASECVGVPWEVIVADNGSTDGSRAVCADYFRLLPLRIVDASDRRGQAHARNVGAQQAGGQKLLFLDQDDVISPGYVAAMGSALDGHRFVAATMDYALLNPPWALEARASAVTSGLRPGLFPWAYGCVLGVDKHLFTAIGGFDEDLPCSEDLDLCWRLHCDAGTEVALIDEAVLHYRLKTSNRALFAQGVLYGRGSAGLFRRWRAVGMEGRSAGAVLRSWAAIVWRLIFARDSGTRAGAWYLFGNRLGCAIGSLSERVVFL